MAESDSQCWECVFKPGEMHGHFFRMISVFGLVGKSEEKTSGKRKQTSTERDSEKMRNEDKKIRGKRIVKIREKRKSKKAKNPPVKFEKMNCYTI